jgi:hypothetical protein
MLNTPDQMQQMDVWSQYRLSTQKKIEKSASRQNQNHKGKQNA